MELREQAYEDYKHGAKYKDIAEKYGVSVNTVKSWASRYWKNDKVATKQRKKSQPKNKKVQPKPRGAPIGNKNAVGNSGGAPLGNQNHYIHGAYSSIYWDTLDDTEKGMIQETPDDEEILLMEQISLFSVRERRIMQSINKYRNMSANDGKPVNLSVSNLIRNEEKREFSNAEEATKYEDMRKQKINDEKISYLGHAYNMTTTMEATIDIVQRLEGLLTQVQAKKTKCIDSLSRLRMEKEKSNVGSKSNEIVDDWISAVTGGDSPDD